MLTLKSIGVAVVTTAVTIALAILAEHYVGIRLVWVIAFLGLVSLIVLNDLHKQLFVYRSEIMTTVEMILAAIGVSFVGWSMFSLSSDALKVPRLDARYLHRTPEISKSEWLQPSTPRTRLPQSDNRPCTFENKLTDCDITHFYASAKTLIEDYREKYEHYQRQKHWWIAGGHQPAYDMAQKEWDSFKKDYANDYRDRLLTLRGAFGVRLHTIPNTGIDVYETYPESEWLMELFVENQLRDQYRLLNEFEQENGLPITFWRDNH